MNLEVIINFIYQADFFKLLYPIVLTCIILSIYLYLKKILKLYERRSLIKINTKDINEPVENQKEKESEKKIIISGIKGINQRFNLIKKILPIIILLIYVLLLTLPYIGKVPSAYISIIAAILSVVTAIALRPFLENLFSGIVVSFFRSVSAGDTVTLLGHYGIIQEINLTHAILKRWDWVRIVIPNSRLLELEIQNFTKTDSFIWAHVEFFVAPSSDIEKVKQIAVQCAKKSKHFNNSEEPSFWVMKIDKDSIECWIAGWTDDPSDAWEFRNEVRTNIVIELKSNNIQLQEQRLSLSQ